MLCRSGNRKKHDPGYRNKNSAMEFSILLFLHIKTCELYSCLEASLLLPDRSTLSRPRPYTLKVNFTLTINALDRTMQFNLARFGNITQYQVRKVCSDNHLIVK